MSAPRERGLSLPRAAEAEVPEEKLRCYALDPEHPTGRHKARVFSSTPAIDRDDGEYLRDQILRRVSESLVASIRPKEPYGIEYEVRMMIDGLNGVTIPIITGWLLPPERRLV